MGLDQYAYVATRASQLDDYYRALETDGAEKVTEPREIAYWRKHPNLQGWMQRLWLRKGGDATHTEFNGVELELTREDIDELEEDIKSGYMASLHTRGFFFGDTKDEYYRDKDLNFVRTARAELFCGLRVFYNSSW